MPGQTVQTQIRLLLEEQSDQANSADPDQTAPREGSGLIRDYTVCPIPSALFGLITVW